MSANIKVNHLQRWTHDGVWMWTLYTCTEQNSTRFVVHSCEVAWDWWPLTLKCPLGLMLPESLSQSMSNFSGTAPSTDWLQEGNKSLLRAGAGNKMEFLLEINWFFSCGPYFLVLISILVFLCNNSQRWFLGLVWSFYLGVHQRRFRLHLQTLCLWFVGLFQAISELYRTKAGWSCVSNNVLMQRWYLFRATPSLGYCPADVCWTVVMVMSQQLAALILLALLLLSALVLLLLHAKLILILHTHLTVFMDLSY